MTVETLSNCQTCGGGLTFHTEPASSLGGARTFWAHFDKPLSETAGHTAVPDPAKTYTVEVD